MKEERKEKECRKRDKRLNDKSWRNLEDVSFFCAFGQNWLCVNAAAEGLQKRTEMVERLQQQEVQVKESRWAEEIPKAETAKRRRQD